MYQFKRNYVLIFGGLLCRIIISLNKIIWASYIHYLDLWHSFVRLLVFFIFTESLASTWQYNITITCARIVCYLKFYRISTTSLPKIIPSRELELTIIIVLSGSIRLLWNYHWPSSLF